MTFALRFLLSPTTTETPNEHVSRPYAHWFSHQRTNDFVFRSVAFPDVVPRLSRNFHLAEHSDFLFLTPLFNAPAPRVPQHNYTLFHRHVFKRHRNLWTYLCASSAWWDVDQPWAITLDWRGTSKGWIEFGGSDRSCAICRIYFRSSVWQHQTKDS